MTICEDCEHFHPDNAKRKPYRCMCMKFPRMDYANFVTTENRLSDPYMYCEHINGGACPLFERKKTNQKELPV